MNKPPSIVSKVVIIDDHELFRAGLKLIIERDELFKVVGEASNGREGIKLATKVLPDIVILDIAMPVLNGYETARQFQKMLPKVNILVVSEYQNPDVVSRMLNLKISGYVTKESSQADFVRALEEIRRGYAFFSPSIAKLVNDLMRSGAQDQDITLTIREGEVLQLITEGRANKQIAAELDISIKTVEKHRQQVMNKLNIHHVAGLTQYVLSKGKTMAAFDLDRELLESLVD